MQRTDKTKITVAVISAGGVIIAALISAPWWLSRRAPQQKMVIAGVVVDKSTNSAIGQARISLSGRTETYVTDDLGNFQIEVRDLEVGHPVRVVVSKSGYRTYDEAVTPPAENFVIQLQRQ